MKLDRQAISAILQFSIVKRQFWSYLGMGHRGPVRSLWHFNHLRTLLLFAVNMQIACAGPAVESRARILARHPHHQQQHHHHWRQWNANAP